MKVRNLPKRSQLTEKEGLDAEVRGIFGLQGMEGKKRLGAEKSRN